MSTFRHALEFAEHAHRGQTDVGGVPYIEHVRGVVEQAQQILAGIPHSLMSDEQRAQTLQIAALHDTLEDTPTTTDGLIEAGFVPDVVQGVERLTGRPPGVTYHDNIQAIADERDLKVIVVKLADNRHNSLPERIAQLPQERQSIVRRYQRSIAILEARLAEIING